MSQGTGVCLAYVTLPVAEDVEALAERLVALGLCAGINIVGPARSIFFWQGETRRKEEWLLFAQIAQDRMGEFKNELLKLHPYVVPCILELAVEAGHLPFINWIRNPGLDKKA